jgi:hypothetical protein
MRFSRKASVSRLEKTLNRRPSKRARPSCVPIHKYPSGVCVIACTVLCGSPASVPNEACTYCVGVFAGLNPKPGIAYKTTAANTSSRNGRPFQRARCFALSKRAKGPTARPCSTLLGKVQTDARPIGGRRETNLQPRRYHGVWFYGLDPLLRARSPSRSRHHPLTAASRPAKDEKGLTEGRNGTEPPGRAGVSIQPPPPPPESWVGGVPPPESWVGGVPPPESVVGGVPPLSPLPPPPSVPPPPPPQLPRVLQVAGGVH